MSFDEIRDLRDRIRALERKYDDLLNFLINGKSDLILRRAVEAAKGGDMRLLELWGRQQAAGKGGSGNVGQ